MEKSMKVEQKAPGTQNVRIKRMMLRPAEFPSVVGQNGAEAEPLLPVERHLHFVRIRWPVSTVSPSASSRPVAFLPRCHEPTLSSDL